MPPRIYTRRHFSNLLVATGLALAACGPRSTGRLRLGHFPNITHGAALVAVERGTFAGALSGGIDVLGFNAGPAAVEALLSRGLDLAFIGPNPTLNAFVQSKGQAIRVISGTTSGGASLVVRSDIESAEQLRGKKLATPQLGNTQDVALRSWLADHELSTDHFGGGDVGIMPQENAQTLETFRAGRIDGAWVPEPWATRLVLEGDGKVLVDERTLWPDGRFVTTHLVARTEVLETRADDVRAVLKAHVETTRFVQENPEEARTIVAAAIERITGKSIPDSLLAAAWPKFEFTTDPLAESLRGSATAAERVGLLDLEGLPLDDLWSLDLLAEVEGGRS